ncbi:MAG: alpha-ketoacid dehydrogenase subunit beta [Chloroflexota bacterium]
MSQVTYIEAIRLAMLEEMERDPSVFILGEDVGAYGGAFKATTGLLQQFGEMRVVDTPLSESAIVGAAIGAAMMGMRPIAEMQFADFIACAFDMIVNVAAKARFRMGADVPLVIRAPFGAGIHGGPYHSQSPEGWFFHTPGLKLVAPATAYDAKGLLKAAIRDDDPVIYFEHKYLYRRIKEDLPDDDFVVPLGQAAVRREGDAVSVVTYGAMVHKSLEAAEALADREGISLEVIDLRSLKPLDMETVATSVRKTGKALVVYEANRTGGIGGEIAAQLAEDLFEYLDGPIVRVASADTPVPYSPPLEEAYLPQVEDIVAAARELAEY